MILIATISVSAIAASLAMILSALMNAKTNPAISNVLVRFLGETGEVLLEKEVPQGAFAIPPSDIPLSNNQVMQGWYGSMLNVSSDSDCRISLKDVTNETNVFYINTQYIPCEGSFEMEVRVGGQVDLSIIELILPYDERTLQYESSKTDIGTVVTKEAGELYFQLDSDRSIEESTVLFSAEFKVDGSPFTFLELKPNITKAITRLENGAETTEYQIIPAKIYLYDMEVSK